jgi:3D (Asp-Asp-Asp) domain-containing protein
MIERAQFRLLVFSALACALLVLFSSCATTRVARTLPPYEPPIARANFQTVRTTAYTHTEADHLEYTNHNALGGVLHAASPPVRRAENSRPVTLALYERGDYRSTSGSAGPQPFSLDDNEAAIRPRRAHGVARARKVVVKTSHGRKVVLVRKAQPLIIGSAAADWARWPVGTTFRLLSTGQVYRVDDYGWALAGRNTIDLYMATPGEMNNWGARQEPIEILRWGDSEESLRLLQPHEDYKHIKRMVLELKGREQEAAQLH